jgi:hypothetical protein
MSQGLRNALMLKSDADWPISARTPRKGPALRTTRHLFALGLWALMNLAHAGRPLSTDDAAAADAGTCQVESWQGHAGSQRAFVLAPACGVVPGVELSADTTWPTPRDVVRQGAGLAVKLAPVAWKMDSGAGELNFGLKLSGAWLKPADARWQSSGVTLLGVASLKATEQVSVHANLGASRDRASSTQATVFNLALVWTPYESLLCFVEGQGNNKKDQFGGTVNTAGARWWLVKDRLGLDITASRESGAAGPARYTVGLGWYGIGS